MSEDLKRCGSCDQDIPRSNFHKNRRKRDGLDTKCKPCRKQQSRSWAANNPERMKELKERWRAENREHQLSNIKDWHLRHKYGITLVEKMAMIESQGGVCKICKTTTWGPRGAAVDHCHATGLIRGILCHACNMGLGAFRDRPDVLARAIEYLNEHTVGISMLEAA